MATNLRESYELLGLPTNATEEEVRKAYKQKARECHPDKNPDDPQATEKFQALRQGYERIVSGSSEEPDDAEYFSGFDNFFHFVIFREMMRRRMREAMMARMFGGIFEDDSDLDEDDFPFGSFPSFGGPFFHQRPRHHESSTRSRNFRFRDQEDSQNGRSSYERGSSAKPPKKQKDRKKNFRKPSYSDCNGNSDGAKQRQSSSKQETTFESDHDETTKYKYGREDFNRGERETCGEERAKPNMFSKSKQRNKNKSQMTASEWQKGRKSKKHHKKRQTAKSSNSSPVKCQASEEKPDWDNRSSQQFSPKTPRNSDRQEDHCCSSAASSPNCDNWVPADTKNSAGGKTQLKSGQFGRELNSVEYDEKVKGTSEREKPGGNRSETIPESLRGEKNGVETDGKPFKDTV